MTRCYSIRRSGMVSVQLSVIMHVNERGDRFCHRPLFSVARRVALTHLRDAPLVATREPTPTQPRRSYQECACIDALRQSGYCPSVRQEDLDQVGGKGNAHERGES
jgi:hypothetical protein